MRRVRRVVITAAKVTAIAVVVTIIVVAATPQGRTGVRAALFVVQVLPAIPVKPLGWVTGDPERREITFRIAGQIAGETGVADLYVPAGEGPFGGMLLFLGVNPAGRDDSRVVNLATGMARTGTVVMIPWSESMTRNRIEVGEIDNLVLAFQHLQGLDIIDPDRVGMAGFCVGASLAIVAAQDERIRDDVRYVNAFGAYFDAVDLVRAVVTKSRFDGGKSEPWLPDALAVEVVRTHLIEGLPDPGDREVLGNAFLEGQPITRAEVDGLSAPGRTVFDLLMGPEPQRADVLLAQLPEGILNSLRLISPKTGIDNLRAKLLIMHDREDTLVPANESRSLFDAVDGRVDTYYTEFSFFSHVDPTEQVGPVTFVREGFNLFLHLYNLMREL